MEVTTLNTKSQNHDVFKFYKKKQGIKTAGVIYFFVYLFAQIAQTMPMSENHVIFENSPAFKSALILARGQ